MKICGDYTPTVVIEIQLLRRCEKMINNIDDKLVEVLKTGFAGDVDLISPSIYNTLTMQNVVGSTGATADAEMLMVLQSVYQSFAKERQQVPLTQMWSQLKFNHNVVDALTSGKFEMLTSTF
ncbi:hypothetical protein Plhal304r1_c002g0005211 [Plasmopara halstedii]